MWSKTPQDLLSHHVPVCCPERASKQSWVQHISTTVRDFRTQKELLLGCVLHCRLLLEWIRLVPVAMVTSLLAGISFARAYYDPTLDIWTAIVQEKTTLPKVHEIQAPSPCSRNTIHTLRHPAQALKSWAPPPCLRCTSLRSHHPARGSCASLGIGHPAQRSRPHGSTTLPKLHRSQAPPPCPRDTGRTGSFRIVVAGFPLI